MQIVMGWPEWIVVGLLLLGLWQKIVSLTRLPEDFATRVGDSLGIIAYIVTWPLLLYWGGFFS